MDEPAPRAIPARLALPGPREIAVWWTPIDVDDAVLARAALALDAASLAKADRMRRDADRRRSLLAHALVRRLLSAITGTPPAELALERRCAGCGSTDHGRPFLAGGASFGISHGGDVAVVALGAPDASVAVDVEAVQTAARWEAVRKHAFSDAEWAATVSDPGAGRTRLWARKEAVVKATGHGLSIELTRVSFAPAAWASSTVTPPGAEQHAGHQEGAGGTPTARGHEEPADDGPLIAEIAPGDPEAPAGPWAVADIELAAGHRAAVAWHGAPAASITTHRAAL